MENVEVASKLFSEEYNCAQAVLASFTEGFKLDKNDAFKIASSFGGGIARNGELCGAVTGALMTIGLKYWDNKKNPADAKMMVYEKSNLFLNEFKSKYGSIKCKDLLGCDLSTEAGRNYAKEKNLSGNICANLVKDSVKILNDLFEEKK